jgi:putative ATP-binding cassette transporter
VDPCRRTKSEEPAAAGYWRRCRRLVSAFCSCSSPEPDFFDALQQYREAAFLPLIGRFALLAGIFIAAAVYAQYLRQMLQIRWRRWMTEHLVSDWLRDRAYYRMGLTPGATDNPDQRIAEDLRLFVEQTLMLSLGLLRQVVSLGSFAVILWSLSGVLTFKLGGLPIAIPGYMLFAALLYSIGGTWLTHWIGKPLPRLNFDQQRYEADYRFSLVRVRERAESIALSAGEADEQRRLSERFSDVWRNWWEIMRRQKRLTTFTVAFDQAAVLFPYIAAAPRYFAKEITFGGLQQTANAFGRVQDALSFFVAAYVELAAWKATVDRLIAFRAELAKRHAPAEGEAIALASAPGDGYAARDLGVALPSGEPLLRGVDLELAAGDGADRRRVGQRQSTLFRALAGTGRLRPRPHRAARHRPVSVPVAAAVPAIGSLRGAISVPAAEGTFSDTEVGKRLAECRLAHLVERLHEHAHWQRPSPGEQRRWRSRALLHQPRWLFLDRRPRRSTPTTRPCTSCWPRSCEATVVSIGHRAALTPSTAAGWCSRAMAASRREPATNHWDSASSPALGRADAHGLGDLGHEDLAVSDAPVRRLEDRGGVTRGACPRTPRARPSPWAEVDGVLGAA